MRFKLPIVLPCLPARPPHSTGRYVFQTSSLKSVSSTAFSLTNLAILDSICGSRLSLYRSGDSTSNRSRASGSARNSCLNPEKLRRMCPLSCPLPRARASVSAADSFANRTSAERPQGSAGSPGALATRRGKRLLQRRGRRLHRRGWATDHTNGRVMRLCAFCDQSGHLDDTSARCETHYWNVASRRRGRLRDRCSNPRPCYTSSNAQHLCARAADG